MNMIVLGSLLMIAYSISTHNIMGFTGWLACVIFAVAYIVKDYEK